MMKYEVQGKKIWLIGASTGIGAALARELALEGAVLLLSARHEDRLRELATSIPGPNHEVWPLDVAEREAFHVAALKLTQAHPDVEMVIYNAGTYEPQFADEMTLGASLATVDTNLTGAYVMLDAVLPPMLARGQGVIVLVASVAGYFGMPRAAAYSASKAGLIALAETLAIELPERGIRTQVVCPGFVRTRLTEHNPFPMPLMISPEKAALYIMKGIERRQFEIHFPQRFTLLMKLVEILPRPLRLALLRRLVKPRSPKASS